MLGVLALVTAAILSIINLWLGWGLSQTEHSPPETHLILGIASLILSCGGCLFMILSADKKVRAKEREALMKNETPKTSEIRDLIGKATRQSYAVFVFFPISMITGTIAHAGRIPLLHLIVGLASFMAISRATFVWWKTARHL